MKESDIRPAALLDAYLALCAQDARDFFTSPDRRDLDCPACGSAEVRPAFEKWGFGYRRCADCGTLYQSPRPPEEEFSRFYRDSPSSRYWAETFFPTVAEARRTRLFAPKVEEIARLCARDAFSPAAMADVGAGYGLFLEEWRKRFPGARAYAVEPNPALAEVCRSKDLTVLECFAEQGGSLPEPLDLVVSLEVIEHVNDPLGFCRSLRDMLAPGGRMLLTGLCSDGFDIQILWDQAKSVSPPQHINFLSVRGFERLMERAGFSAWEVFTPGKLDVDIVANCLGEDSGDRADVRFVRCLLSRGETARQAFQEFLSANGLSSHCWVWAKK